MVCAPACLSRNVIPAIVVVLHPIQRDGGEGFFYARELSASALSRWLPSIVGCGVTQKECAYGRFS